MEKAERVAKWILTGMIFFAVVSSMLFSFVMTPIQDNNKREPVKISTSHPPLYLTTKSSGPHTWEYYIWLSEGGYGPIKKGAILSIGGDGITSASVVGEALLEKFGVWQVKEIKDNCVIFEATKDTNLVKSFEGFSITAARATKQTETNWGFAFEPFEIDGKKIPVPFTQGTAWGPGK
jgi:hypothetical protein